MSKLDESVEDISFILEDATDFDEELERRHFYFKQIVIQLKTMIEKQLNDEKE